MQNLRTNPELDDVTEKRKLRNRLSQQAFRKRQSDYIRELEKHNESLSKTGDERIAKLAEENKLLRQQLTKIINKLESAQGALKSLSQSANRTLQSSSNESTITIEDTSEPSCNRPESAIRQADKDTSCSSFSLSDSTGPTEMMSSWPPLNPGVVLLDESHGFEDSREMCASNTELLSEDTDQTLSSNDENFCLGPAAGFTADTSCVLAAQRVIDVHRTFELSSSNSLASAQALPCGSPTTGLSGVWSHQYQMGPAAFLFASAASPSNSSPLHSTNSAFSDHIRCLQHVLKEKWLSLMLPDSFATSLSQVHTCASMMLSIFNSLARAPAMSWYNHTKFYDHIADLTMWQINRTREMYIRLPARYKPSALQLTEAYPPIIDWHPFPSVRDKLILFHAGNPSIDRIIGDLGTAYVVETDLSKLVKLDCPTLGYVRVWDIIQAMGEPNDTTLDQNSHDKIPFSASAFYADEQLSLPAPDVEALFRTKSYARLAFETLHMAEGVSLYKLDPTVFEKYPELYDSDCSFIANGKPLKPATQTAIPGPMPLDKSTLNTYHHFAGWAFNVITKAFKSSQI